MSEGSLAISMRGVAWFKDGDTMGDATAIDETTNVFTSPRCRVENFFWRKYSSGGVGNDVGVAVADVLERDVPRERNVG